MIRTLECVSPKHPDKMCDRISDTLLDLSLKQVENSRCVLKLVVVMERYFVTGEVTSQDITEDDIKNIVYIVSGVEDVIIHLNHNHQRLSRS